jgi:hypothetical protein
MPIAFPAYAALLTAIVPLLVATAMFFLVLARWIDRILRSDPAVQARLRLQVTEHDVTWEIDSRPRIKLPLPYLPTLCAVLSALVVVGIETGMFAYRSEVPTLWYQSGAVAALLVAVVIVLIIGASWPLLRRLIDRKLVRHATQSFKFASKTLLEVREISRQIDAAYGSIGLNARTHPLELCRDAIFEHADHGDDTTFAEIIGVKIRFEHNFRSLQYLAYRLNDARTTLADAKPGLQAIPSLLQALTEIEDRTHSRQLVDALEDARWPDADQLIKTIRSDVARMTSVVTKECHMPQSAEEAYLLLNVSGETQIAIIKELVNTYWRVWHPDLAQDDLDLQRRTFKVQQINGAWNLIQKARNADSDANLPAEFQPR